MEIESGRDVHGSASASRSRRHAWFALLAAFGMCVAGCVATTTLSMSVLSGENRVELSRIYRTRLDSSHDRGSIVSEEAEREVESTRWHHEEPIASAADVNLPSTNGGANSVGLQTAAGLASTDAGARSTFSSSLPPSSSLREESDSHTIKERGATELDRHASLYLTEEKAGMARLNSSTVFESAAASGEMSKSKPVNSEGKGIRQGESVAHSTALSDGATSAQSQSKGQLPGSGRAGGWRTAENAARTPDADSDTGDLAGSESSGNPMRRGEGTGAPTAAKPFAYMFYATSDQYACAALQLMDGLVNRVGMDASRIDLVVLHGESVSAALLRRARDQVRARTIPVEVLLADAGDSGWLMSLTKLRAFQDWGYHRVVFLDSDAVVMQSLDHLFDLPPARLYAPTAYWLPQPFFASTLMVIEPADAVFRDMLAWARSNGPAAGFDMDILNAYLGDSARHLPGEYTVLNSDFRQPSSAPSKLFSTTAELRGKAKVVHFSCTPDGAYGKPWAWTRDDLSVVDNTNFDPLFRELFVQYWEGERRVCGW